MFLHLAIVLSASSGDAPDFDSEVLPILSEHCFHCHGPDAATREADLRLDSADAIFSVVEPGDVDGSELHSRITETDPDWVMPPPGFEKPLTALQIKTLREWIDAGAKWESHWAFQPLVSSGESLHSIDEFVEQVHSGEGLSFSKPADPPTWLRRVTLDLTGLPPTLAELDGFEQALLRSGDPEATKARVVDDLLARPSHAEHRARQWLDVARYADTNGYQNDFRRDQWPWRDWVLRAFQSNMPYDRFVTLQVAGDLVEAADTEEILGTGFQRNHRMVTEAGSLDEEWRVENVADRAETTATAFLGLTLACARCHDHKYDQLTQRDYYAFYGFFNSIDEKGVYQETRGNVPPLISVPTPAQTERLAELDREIGILEQGLKDLEPASIQRFDAWRKALGALNSASLPRPRLTYSGSADQGDALSPQEPGTITLDGKAETALDLGRAVSFAGDEPFTVSLWVKPSGHGAVYSRMADDDTYQGTDLVLLGDMRPAVHLIHSWPSNAIKVTAKRPLRQGAWSHVGVSYDGSGGAAGVMLCVNGVPQELEVNVDKLDGTIATDQPLRLGTRRYAGDLKGELLDFRVDGAFLEPQELLQLGQVRATSSLAIDFFAACFDEPLMAKNEALRAVLAERDRIQNSEVPTAMVLKDSETPRDTFVLNRGQYDKPVGQALTPDVPAYFGGLPEGVVPDRSALAQWLVDPSNPLTARVAVNRTWASFFGAGLSRTQNDFGVRGDRPRHRALLDHLATTFIESGWDMAALERQIVLSRVYGQSSEGNSDLVALDPSNRLLARGPRHRLDAEVVRDQALLASGLLKPRFGGPPVKPYQPDGLWAELAGGAGQGAYVPSKGDDLFRRSLYTYRKRTVPHPTLTTFDAPGFELCTVERPRTNTPLQALAVMNDVTYVEAARHLAKVMMEGDREPWARLARGFRALLSRDPSQEELVILDAALTRHRAEFDADPAAAVELLSPGASAPPESERTPEWAAYTMVASTLLNLDEAITKR